MTGIGPTSADASADGVRPDHSVDVELRKRWWTRGAFRLVASGEHSISSSFLIAPDERMEMFSRVARRIALISTIVALVAAAAPSTASAYRFLQFNVCGSKCNNGADGGNVGQFSSVVANHIITFEPHAVSLNEVCRSQYDEIKRLVNATSSTWKMADGAWRQTHGFPSTGAMNNCDNNEFGNAILTKNAITVVNGNKEVDTVELWESGDETRKLVCAKTEIASRPTRACTVHIDNRNDDAPHIQYEQTRQVDEQVDRYLANDTAVVLMGDFNVAPLGGPLDRIYHGSLFGNGAWGQFKEVDQRHQSANSCRCGERTVDGTTLKYDYIFLSGDHWQVVGPNGGSDGDGGEAVESGFSDHSVLKGWADTL